MTSTEWAEKIFTASSLNCIAIEQMDERIDKIVFVVNAKYAIAIMPVDDGDGPRLVFREVVE